MFHPIKALQARVTAQRIKRQRYVDARSHAIAARDPSVVRDPHYSIRNDAPRTTRVNPHH